MVLVVGEGEGRRNEEPSVLGGSWTALSKVSIKNKTM